MINLWFGCPWTMARWGSWAMITLPPRGHILGLISHLFDLPCRLLEHFKSLYQQNFLSDQWKSWKVFEQYQWRQKLTTSSSVALRMIALHDLYGSFTRLYLLILSYKSDWWKATWKSNAMKIIMKFSSHWSWRNNLLSRDLFSKLFFITFPLTLLCCYFLNLPVLEINPERWVNSLQSIPIIRVDRLLISMLLKISIAGLFEFICHLRRHCCWKWTFRLGQF